MVIGPSTTVRAWIAAASFSYNVTSSFGDIQIELNYRLFDQPGEQTPFWAVEKTDAAVSDINPIWGLVDPVYANFS